MIYLFLANGFEEIEALTTVDFLRRCSLDVVTVGVESINITGSHNIKVQADIIESDMELNDSLQAIILPGGVPGTPNQENSLFVQKAIDYAVKNDKFICAICAAPSILGKKGLLKHKKATCFPGWEKYLLEANVTGNSVECDGKYITAKGAGVTIDFASAIAENLLGSDISEKTRKKMQCK